MRVNGIIAEYNPFHNGHRYQMEESRRLTGADYTVVVMSGDFVQRGAPALADKHARAEMALRCGADLVLELPDTSEYEYGYMVYFFEKACAISGYLSGVNPFDQPGVEAYKKNMFALLGKPGYEELRAGLLEKLN